MKNKLLALYWVFISCGAYISTAYAHDDQYVMDAGLGSFGTEGSSLSQVKFLKVGIQEDLWEGLKQRFNGGAWLDSRGDGRTNSLFTSYQLGFEVSNNIFQASVFSGPALISSPDSDLGGIFQFNETIFLGIVDKDYDSIGVSWNHLSSAGLEQPNQGKDFLCLEIKFPFY
jgi:hypothetical protein